MNISDLLGAMTQSGMAPSSNQRLQNAFGGGSGGLLESLGGLLGGQKSGGGLGEGPPFRCAGRRRWRRWRSRWHARGGIGPGGADGGR